MSFAQSVYSVLLAVPVPVPALVCFLVAHKRIQADKVKANFIGLKRRRTTTTGNEQDDDGDAIMLANCKTICLGKGRKKKKREERKAPNTLVSTLPINLGQTEGPLPDFVVAAQKRSTTTAATN